MKFATKCIRQYPPRLRYVTTLPWEIKKVDFLQVFCKYEIKCKQILIFSVFKIWSLSPYRLQIKFSMSLFFYLLTIVINLWHQKFITAFVIAVFVNKQQSQHGIQRRGPKFDKKFVFKELHSKEVDRRIF